MKTSKFLILLTTLFMLAVCSQQTFLLQVAAPADAPAAQAPAPKGDITPGIRKLGEERPQPLSVSSGLAAWQTITQDWIAPGTTRFTSSTDPTQLADAGPGDDVPKQLQFPGGFVFPFFGQNKATKNIARVFFAVSDNEELRCAEYVFGLPAGNCPHKRRAAFLVKTGRAPNSAAALEVPRLYARILSIWQLWQAMHGPNPPLTRSAAGIRDFDINLDGLAHYVMLPDFLQQGKNGGQTCSHCSS